jgi:hypothetical protein
VLAQSGWLVHLSLSPASYSVTDYIPQDHPNVLDLVLRDRLYSHGSINRAVAKVNGRTAKNRSIRKLSIVPGVEQSYRSNRYLLRSSPVIRSLRQLAGDGIARGTVVARFIDKQAETVCADF